MTKRSVLLSAGTALSILLASSAVLADMPVPDDDEEDKTEEKARESGNAVDKATQPPPAAGLPAVDRASLPPGYYTEMGDFWSLFLGSGGNLFAAGEEIADIGADIDPPQLVLEPMPSDAPAESILDEIDERQAQLPMVGMPGSEANGAAGQAAASTETSTPPPESILDFIDGASSTPTTVSNAHEATKPAANQAPKPEVVKAAPQ